MGQGRDIKVLFDSEYRNAMVSWFASTYGGSQIADKVLSYLVGENHSDEMIYSLTHDYRKKYTDLHKMGLNKAGKRSKNRKKQVDTLIDGLEYPKNIYLDIGCEAMTEPETYGQTLGIAEVRCINIKDWVGAYEENVHAVDDDKRYSYYDGVNIPYDDNSISIVTMNMVIHHVSDNTKEELLQNVYRVLEPGGLLIIREHSSYDDPKKKDMFDLFLDFIHHFFDSVINKEYRWVDDYETTYTSADTLKGVLEKIGFESLKRIKFKRGDRAYQEVFRVVKD